MIGAKSFSAPLTIDFIFVNLTPRSQIVISKNPNIGRNHYLFHLKAINLHLPFDLFFILFILNVHTIKPTQLLAQPIELSLIMPIDPIFGPDRLMLLNGWITL